MEGEKIIEPLLYITQPVHHKPKAYMQEHYHTRNTTENVTVTKETKVNEENDSFVNLSIDEKIKYLVNLAKEVPKIRCEVITKEGKKKGLIIGENEQEIMMRIFGRENAIINKEAINEINLIGF